MASASLDGNRNGQSASVVLQTLSALVAFDSQRFECLSWSTGF